MKLEWYYRRRRCKACGSYEFRWDRYRDEVEWHRHLCRCGGVAFPHRKGVTITTHAHGEMHCVHWLDDVPF